MKWRNTRKPLKKYRNKVEVKLKNSPQPNVTRRRASTQGVKGCKSGCPDASGKRLVTDRKHRMTRKEEQQKI
jgi:hypothetical protein